MSSIKNMSKHTNFFIILDCYTAKASVISNLSRLINSLLPNAKGMLYGNSGIAALLLKLKFQKLKYQKVKL